MRAGHGSLIVRHLWQIEEIAALKRNDKFTRLLAMGGTVLVWLPLLAPAVLAVRGYFAAGMLLFDYLMPAELAVLALAGAALLLWAALRAHDRRGLIGGATAVAFVVVALLYSSEGVMPGTWQEKLLFTGLAAYAAGLAAMGVGGALLIYDLFRRTMPPAAV
jgi:hypothetical protein